MNTEQTSKIIFMNVFKCSLRKTEIEILKSQNISVLNVSFFLLLTSVVCCFSFGAISSASDSSFSFYHKNLFWKLIVRLYLVCVVSIYYELVSLIQNELHLFLSFYLSSVKYFIQVVQYGLMSLLQYFLVQSWEISLSRKVKHELEVASYELRHTRYEFGFTSYLFNFTILTPKLWVRKHEFGD